MLIIFLFERLAFSDSIISFVLIAVMIYRFVGYSPHSHALPHISLISWKYLFYGDSQKCTQL